MSISTPIRDLEIRIAHIFPLQSYLAVYAIGMVVSQSVKGGFRFRAIDEIEERKRHQKALGTTEKISDDDLDKKAGSVYVERV